MHPHARHGPKACAESFEHQTLSPRNVRKYQALAVNFNLNFILKESNRMFRRSVLVLGILIGVLALAPFPALANTLDTATATVGCSSYTISFTASDLVVGTTYSINWTISGLGPDISDSITFTASAATYSSGPITRTITALNGTFTASGMAQLVNSFGTQFNFVNISFSPTSLTCGGSTPPPPPPCQQTATNSSNFNGTSVPTGSFIWFNANFKAQNVPSSGVTIDFTSGSITFTAGGTSYNLQVPNAKITFSPSASCSSTTFDTSTGTWITTVPISGDDEIFLTGLAWQIPSGGLAAGANPVNFNGTYSAETSAPGLSIQMTWSAAAYSSFTTDYNAIGVKAGHQTACGQSNGDHAGTPEGVDSTNTPWKHYLVGGPRGGGGSNFTGSWSGTLQINICP